MSKRVSGSSFTNWTGPEGGMDAIFPDEEPSGGVGVVVVREGVGPPPP